MVGEATAAAEGPMALGATATESTTTGGVTAAAGELVTCGVAISDASPSSSSRPRTSKPSSTAVA